MRSHSNHRGTLQDREAVWMGDRLKRSFPTVNWLTPWAQHMITYSSNKSRIRSYISTTFSIRLNGSICPFGLLRNDPPSNPDLKSIRDATASCDPIYWSSEGGKFDRIGLPDALSGALIEDEIVAGDFCWFASSLRSSTISLSISAFLLRFPTRLKLDSILHSRFRRWHRPHAKYVGSWTTSHRNYKGNLN